MHRLVAEVLDVFVLVHRRALIIDDLDTARDAKKLGHAEYGARVNVVRIRRRGTCGLEAVRLRPDLGTATDDDSISMTPADAMKVLATITRAKTTGGIP